MGSEAKDDILDVDHYGKTNCFLCCPDVVAENQNEGIRERMREWEPSGLLPLEVAIGLTPLPLWIKGEARASYLICRFGNATQRGNIAHLNFSQDTVLENLFNMGTDTAILRYSFAKKFTVTYPDHNEWKRQNIQSLSKGPVWYTDGTKTLVLGAVYSGVKPDWVPSPLSSRQRYFP
jgi:hypothetical protein